MQQMKAGRKIALLIPGAAFIVILVLSATQPVSAQDSVRLHEIPYSPTLRPTSGQTTTYFAFPFQKLKEAVPALKGLKYDDSQERLPSILAGVAQTIANVLPRLPNLVSKEDISGFQAPRDPSAAGGLPNAQPWSREFRYLILCHQNADGSTTIEELRTDAKGNAADAAGQFAAPRGFGFAYQWLFFTSANQLEFRFRYLGQQDKGGRKTFVVAFAQNPGKVTNPALFQSEGKVSPFYYQGVLWVDQSTFDVVMLRTDLLDALPDLHLTQLTTELSFRLVHIHDSDAEFWLPNELSISSDQGAGPAEESHRYSDYHLYRSTARIVPPPSDTSFPK
jgi:hypothetical protein